MAAWISPAVRRPTELKPRPPVMSQGLQNLKFDLRCWTLMGFSVMFVMILFINSIIVTSYLLGSGALLQQTEATVDSNSSGVATIKQ